VGIKKKEIEIDWEGKKEKVIVKKLTFGEMNEIIRQVVGKITIIGAETPSINIDIVAYREMLLLKSIEYAPFKVDIETIRNLEPEIAMQILAVAEELNPFRSLL
jgi:hypothetical protein